MFITQGGRQSEQFIQQVGGRSSVFGALQNDGEHWADVGGRGTHHGDLHFGIVGIFDRELCQGATSARVVPFAEAEGQLIADADGRIIDEFQQCVMQLAQSLIVVTANIRQKCFT